MVRTPSLAVDAASLRLSLTRTGEGADVRWTAQDEETGRVARGATPEEAVRRVIAHPASSSEATPAAAESREATTARHSGRLLVRMPATLHDELARAAESEGVSLNQLITGVLAGAVEWRAGEDHAERTGSVATRGPASSRGGRLFSVVPVGVALAANFVLVALAGALAIALLLVAWLQS
jgi:hypothetical protein